MKAFVFVLARVMFVLLGLAALLINLAILNLAGGFWAAALGFILFPAMIGLAPWYALIAWGAWIALAVTYGGGVLVMILFAAGGEFE